MDNNNKHSLEELKEKDLVDYLSELGHQPCRIRNNDYWYLSPLRDEKNASFKINRKLNRWFDHGLGQGGNLIDFGVRYQNCSVTEFLKEYRAGFSVQPLHVNKPETTPEESKITVIQDTAIRSFYLTRYLEQMKIPLDIAKEFCREITYELNAKKYYGLGFKNDSGGYEIRNPFFKISSSPKDITTINNGSNEASIFEGFIDFLSFKSIHRNQPVADTDYVILNSVFFLRKRERFYGKT